MPTRLLSNGITLSTRLLALFFFGDVFVKEADDLQLA